MPNHCFLPPFLGFKLLAPSGSLFAFWQEKLPENTLLSDMMNIILKSFTVCIFETLLYKEVRG